MMYPVWISETVYIYIYTMYVLWIHVYSNICVATNTEPRFCRFCSENTRRTQNCVSNVTKILFCMAIYENTKMKTGVPEYLTGHRVDQTRPDWSHKWCPIVFSPLDGRPFYFYRPLLYFHVSIAARGRSHRPRNKNKENISQMKMISKTPFSISLSFRCEMMGHFESYRAHILTHV